MSTNEIYAGKLTPEIIAGGYGMRFIVPLYQRLFAWSGEEVGGLLADLRLHFEKWPCVDPSDSHFPYYLGVVTTVPYKGRYCLVDGQQRFTVLMIMASVLAGISPSWKAFFENGNRLELFAREDDARYLKGLASGITGGKYRNPLMAEAYGVIADFLAAMSPAQQRQFAGQCFSRITVFNSVLPDSYLLDPASLNRYFEVMNSAGVNLEQHEILKVSMLGGQKNQTRLLQIWNLCSDLSAPLLPRKENVGDEDYSGQYLTLFGMSADEAVAKILESNNNSVGDDEFDGAYPTIAEIDIAQENNLGSTSGDKNERSVLSFSEFLLLALDIYRNLGGDWKFYKVDELNRRFKDCLLDSPADVPGFYDLLLKLRVALDLFVIRRKSDGQDSEYNLIFCDGGNRVENDCLEQYEAMLSVSTPYYKWVKAVLEYVLDSQSDNTASGILSALKIWDNAQHPFPESVSALSYGKVDRYWFWRLDYCLWERAALRIDGQDEPEGANRLARPYRQAVLDYIFRTNRSIEHLHPQNEAFNSSWDRADIDSFGNLAMISQGFNSQQSNEAVNVKFSRIETQARNHTLQSIKLLMMYVSVKGNYEGWTPEAAKRHEEEMMRILRESYPKA